MSYVLRTEVVFAVLCIFYCHKLCCNLQAMSHDMSHAMSHAITHCSIDSQRYLLAIIRARLNFVLFCVCM